MTKCLVLFVEGETEVEFYRQVIVNAEKRCPNGTFDINIECRNINSAGAFKKIVLRKFIKEIRPKYGDECDFTAALCRDADVFEFSQKPPVRWDEVEKDLRSNHVADVIHVEAKHSIEDWFLYDAEGIKKFLRLSKKVSPTGQNGYEKLKYLYRRANKMYYKGMRSNGMVNHLDIDKITNAVKDQLEPLYKALGADINK